MKVEPIKATLSDLHSINKIIKSCIYTRPVTDRMKRLTQGLLYLQTTDFELMEIWIIGVPIIGVIALREMEAGVLLHSLYIDPKAAGKGVGRSLVNKAIFLTLETNHSRLIVKAFKEAVGFFTKVWPQIFSHNIM